ncbi:MAG: hypothetical protein IJ518_05560 [Clostridia bacterium]|nr:hypothetical protein [Clostridia bacterium]
MKNKDKQKRKIVWLKIAAVFCFFSVVIWGINFCIAIYLPAPSLNIITNGVCLLGSLIFGISLLISIKVISNSLDKSKKIWFNTNNGYDGKK